MSRSVLESRLNATKRLVRIALIGAIYTALSFAVAPFAFGPLQFRVGEALTVLPGMSVLAIPGLTLGCVLTNLLGAISSMNPLGMIDAVIGSTATLLAALLSYLVGKKVMQRRLRYLLIPLPPVLVNAVIIGAELSFLYSQGQAFGVAFVWNFFLVLIGQAVVCYGLGVPLMVLLERRDLRGRLFLD